MRNTIIPSIALVIVQALAACSSDRSPAKDTSKFDDAGAPLNFANDWTLSVLAGDPGGMGTQDGFATDARFFLIKGIARSGDKLYLSDSGNAAIREYDLTTNQVTTLAGHLGALNTAVQDGVGTEAFFRFPGSIAVLGPYLYVSDNDNQVQSPAQLRSVDLASGNVVTVKDPTGQPWAVAGDSSLVLSASSTRLYVASDKAIYAYDPDDNAFQLVIGAPNEPENIVDGDVDTARFGDIGAMSYDGNGGLYVMDAGDLRFVDLTTQEVQTLAGSDHLTGDAGVIQGYPGLADGTGENAQFQTVVDVSFSNPTTYLLDTPDSPIFQEKGPLAYAYEFGRIRAYDTQANAVETVAGYLPRPTAIVGETDGPLETARFLSPRAAYADGDYLYVGSYASLRRVSTTTGQVQLVAGALITSPLFRPGALAFSNGALYTFSRSQLQIMGIDTATGAMSTVVGFEAAKFRTTNCVAMAVAENTLYCASFYIDSMTQSTIRKVYTVNLANTNVDSVSELLGTRIVDMAPSANGLLVLEAGRRHAVPLLQVDPNNANSISDQGEIDLASDYASTYARLVASNGSVYVTDGTRVVRYDLATRTTQTIAGSEVAAGCADGIGAEARFTQLSGIAEGPGGLFVADGMCHTVSFLNLDTGKVTQLAGSPNNVIFKVGQGSDAGINWPSRLAYDAGIQVLYVADSMDNVIGRLTPAKH